MVLLLHQNVVPSGTGVVWLRAKNVRENTREGSHGILVATHHHVAEANIVVDGDLALGNARVQAFLVELDMLEHAESLVVVA